METDIIKEDKLYNPMIKPLYAKCAEGYKSLEQKKTVWSNPRLKYERIDNIEQFIAFHKNHYNNKSCIFRGVTDAKYKILTSLQVAFHVKELKDLSYDDRVLFIQKEIDSIKKNLDKYVSKKQLPKDMEDVDLLYMSFMQHFGLYTPFLDFSYNLNKALFFMQDGMTIDEKSKVDIEGYASLYWLQPRMEVLDQHPTLQWLIDAGVRPEYELVNIIDFYKNNLLNVIPEVKSAMKEYEYIDTRILEPHNFYSWSCDLNNSEGLHKLDLGFLADSTNKPNVVKTFKELTSWLENLKPKMKNSTLSENEYITYIEALQSSLEYNIKLTNINIQAQEGCFLFFNPSNKSISLEDFWINDSRYSRLPVLNCVDIKKQVIIDYIRQILDEDNINTNTIYPKGKDSAKLDMTPYLEQIRVQKQL